ncbi:MAG: hypothetical protein IPH82_01415 [Chloroflexi bacterium]|nr:hypothetical protein [Chloroflexota bacterium]
MMVEGLLLGGAGLGVLALIFEIAADAFSVAAYQTLLAIHGAQGHHEIAIAAFILLSVLLFLGIVPAYKAGAYLRPTLAAAARWWRPSARPKCAGSPGLAPAFFSWMPFSPLSSAPFPPPT